MPFATLRRVVRSAAFVAAASTLASALPASAQGDLLVAPTRVILDGSRGTEVVLSNIGSEEAPRVDRKAAQAAAAEAAEGVSIKLVPIYGVTIPIIVRHGKLEAQVAINQPRVEEAEEGPQLVLTLSRAGDRSTYGELIVTKPGVADPVVVSRGLAVYPELGSREVRIPLTAEQKASLTGPLRFEYREMPEAGGALIAAVDAALG